MLKKTITYTDYNGVERTEDFYFNLTKAELMEMQLGTSGGMTDMITKIVNAKDVPSIMATFKKILMMSYGEKSADGKYFHKSKEISENFAQTEAYSQLFTELFTDSTSAADFINGIIPADAAKALAEQKVTLPGQANN